MSLDLCCRDAQPLTQDTERLPMSTPNSFNAIVPESFPYQHTCEGPDDMPRPT